MEIMQKVDTAIDIASKVKDSAGILWDHLMWAVDDIQEEVINKPKGEDKPEAPAEDE